VAYVIPQIESITGLTQDDWAAEFARLDDVIYTAEDHHVVEAGRRFEYARRAFSRRNPASVRKDEFGDLGERYGGVVAGSGAHPSLEGLFSTHGSGRCGKPVAAVRRMEAVGGSWGSRMTQTNLTIVKG